MADDSGEDADAGPELLAFAAAQQLQQPQSQPLPRQPAGAYAMRRQAPPPETAAEAEAELRLAIARDGLQLHVAPASASSPPSSPGGIGAPMGMPAELEAQYEVGPKAVGKGKFSTVFKAVRRSDRLLVAVKQIALFDIVDARSRDKCLKEIRLVQSLRHPHIIKYIDGFFEGRQLCLVFEFAEAGDLKRQLKKAREKEARFDERVIWKYFSQVAEAVAHMHSLRILHRDLKPANIFLTLQGTVKVGDLGLSRLLSENTLEAHSKVGTPLYMSPEVLRGQGYERSSDIWSLGCILYELAMLRSPFKEEGLNLYELFRRITDPSFAYPPISDVYSDELRGLVDEMLRREPGERPDIDEVVLRANAMRDSTARARDAAKAAQAAAEAEAAAREAAAKQTTDTAAAAAVAAAAAQKAGGLPVPLSLRAPLAALGNVTGAPPVSPIASAAVEAFPAAPAARQPGGAAAYPIARQSPLEAEAAAAMLLQAQPRPDSALAAAGASAGAFPSAALLMAELIGSAPCEASALLCDRLALLSFGRSPAIGGDASLPLLPHRACFALPAPAAAGGISAQFRRFVAVAQWLLQLGQGQGLRAGIRGGGTSGGLDPDLLAGHRSGMVAPLEVATAVLVAASTSSSAASSAALSGVSAASLLPGCGASVLRLLLLLAESAASGVAGTPSAAAVGRFGEAEEVGEDFDVEGEAEGEKQEGDGGVDEARGGKGFWRGGSEGKDESDEGKDDEALFSAFGSGQNGAIAVPAAASDLGGGGGGVSLDVGADPALWRAEVERVAPRLLRAVAAAADAAPGGGGVGAGAVGGGAGEWRQHVERTQAAQTLILKELPATRLRLGELSDGLAELLDLVAAREKFINSSFRGLVADFKGQSERHAALSVEAAAAQQRVAALGAELGAVSEALEDASEMLAARGGAMSDQSPLIRLKAALASLRSDCRVLNLRLGVASAAVFSSRVVHRHEGMGPGGEGAQGFDGDAGETAEVEMGATS